MLISVSNATLPNFYAWRKEFGPNVDIVVMMYSSVDIDRLGDVVVFGAKGGY